MAVRWPFGGEIAAWTFSVNTSQAVSASTGVDVTAWSARSGGSQYTDLASDANGTTTFDHVTSEDGSSGTAPAQVPPFWGPPGIKGMWLSAGGGPRAWVQTTAAADYAVQAGGATACMQPVVPLYEYPSFFGSGWDTIGANGFGMVIANPASGPGVSVNSDWEREINSARAAGMKVLGYVTTDSSGAGGTTAGSRATSAIQTDITQWHALYAVDGIFFDLTPTGVQAVAASYVTTICDMVHAAGPAQVAVINPGTYPLTGDFVAPADIACVYEGDFNDNSYMAAAIPGYATWVDSFLPTKYLHLIYGADTITNMDDAVAHARDVGVAYVFVSASNSAWLTLPSYWDVEVDRLKATHPVLDPLNRGNHRGTVPPHALDTGDLPVNAGHVLVKTVGKGLKVKEGTNARMGTATLTGASTVTVTTNQVATTSRIFVTIQSPSGTVGAPYVFTRSAGTSFGLRSTSSTDASTVAWMIVDPA